MQQIEEMYGRFLDEYGSEDAVRKYTTVTAGYGISYLLQHDYAHIYLSAVRSYLQASPPHPLRLLEFGCGGGMNITRLISLLENEHVPIECAYGTDFSPRLIEAAQREARTFLSPQLSQQIHFRVARNELLIEDLAANENANSILLNFFDLILGVNTFRYCHRLGKQVDCATDIYRLLRPGGICIIIDMNSKFPAFRSRLRGFNPNSADCYLPSLEEYADPFKRAGFDVIDKKNFCWTPHSAGPSLTFCCQFATPILNLVARKHAMRSLVIARKSA